MADKRCGESRAGRGRKGKANRNYERASQRIVTTNRLTSISESASEVYESSAGASAPSSLSAGLSASCISDVQRVRLSRSSCIMRVESL